MRHRKTILKWSLISGKFAYRVLATHAETICRHSFGERYRLNLIASAGCYSCYAALVMAFAPNTRLVDLWALIILGLLVYHFIAIWRRGHVRIHSYSTGLSWNIWQRWRLPTSIVRIFIEPGIIFLIGEFAAAKDFALASWLYLSAGSLLLKEIAIAWKHRREVLDAIDARIESEQMNEAIAGRTTRRRQAEQSPASVSQTSNQSQTPPPLSQMFENLDAALRQAMNARSPNPPASREQGRSPLAHLPRITSRGRNAGP